jgi:hypothetical protein
MSYEFRIDPVYPLDSAYVKMLRENGCSEQVIGSLEQLYKKFHEDNKTIIGELNRLGERCSSQYDFEYLNHQLVLLWNRSFSKHGDLLHSAFQVV